MITYSTDNMTITVSDKEVKLLQPSSIYYYKGITFDYCDLAGVIIVRRVSHRARKPNRVSTRQWKALIKFSKLSREEREEYMVRL